MRLSLDLGLGSVATSSAGVVGAVFSMTQVAARRVYQRTTTTGGGAGKGKGTIPATLNVTQAGRLYARCRSAADGTTILQAAWLVGNVPIANGPVNVTDVDARLGWFHLDLSGDGVTWSNGSVAIGMGAVIAVSGQSLAVRLFGKIGDSTTMAALGVTIDPNCAVYATYTDTGRPSAGLTAAWAFPADGTDYDSAFTGEFLRREVAVRGVNCALAGHSKGSTAISVWVPGGDQNDELRAILDAVGGFEAMIWFQGHSNASAGTTKASYKSSLDLLFADLTAHNAGRGANYQRLLCAIPNINSASWGSQPERDAIRQAHLEWADANGGIYSIPMDIVLYDGVHQTQAGSQRLGERFSAAFHGTALVAPALTMTTPTYAAGKSGFGQEITAGYGLLALASLEAINGQEWSLEGVISLASAPPGNRVAFGAANKGYVGVASDGRLYATFRSQVSTDIFFNGTTGSGGGTNPVISDGLRHHVRLCVTATGGYLFVDGVLIGNEATVPRMTAQTSDLGVHTFGFTPGSFILPGTIDEVAVWATCKTTADFTVPSAPYVGNETALIGLYHLDSAGAGLMAG